MAIKLQWVLEGRDTTLCMLPEGTYFVSWSNLRPRIDSIDAPQLWTSSFTSDAGKQTEIVAYVSKQAAKNACVAHYRKAVVV